MPASCDVFVTQLRKWLDREAGGGPRWAPGVESAPGSSGAAASAASEKATPGSAEERRLVLDRKAQHVRLCTVCQKGEKQLKKARDFLVGVSLFALLGLAAVVGGWLFGGAGAPAARGGIFSTNRAVAAAAAGCSLVAALSAKLAKGIHWGLLPNFGFRDYVHAHKN